jgi:hypothetical protein
LLARERATPNFEVFKPLRISETPSRIIWKWIFLKK